MYTIFKTIPQLAYILRGGSMFLFLKNLLLLEYFLITREFIFKDVPMRFRFVFRGEEFCFIFTSKMDIASFKEIFIFKEYEWDVVTDPQVIVDLGAHTGDTALYYHLRYPDAKIFAVEPEPTLFERLKQNTAHTDKITPIHAGVADQNGVSALQMSTRGSLAGSLQTSEVDGNSVQVPVMTFEDLFLKYSIPRADLCKFDIEGAEEFLFSHNAPEFYADAYIGEVHDDLMRMNKEAFTSCFKEFSFTMQPLIKSKRYLITACRK